MATPVKLRPERPWTREQFDEHVDKWLEETQVYSSLQQMMTNWHCLRLIAQGQRTLPWIMDRLRRDDWGGVGWFCVLYAITGIDPGAGIVAVEPTRQAWLAWAEDWVF